MTRPNEGLRKSQQKQREETYQKIQKAVEFLKEEGREITKVNIREESGLAASTFSKDHVKKFLLETYGLGVKRPGVLLKQDGDIDNKEYNKLLKLNAKLQADLRKAEQVRDKERTRRTKAEKKHDELSLETKILRGELDIAVRKLRNLGGISPEKAKAEVIRLFQGGENEEKGD